MTTLLEKQLEEKVDQRILDVSGIGDIKLKMTMEIVSILSDVCEYDGITVKHEMMLKYCAGMVDSFVSKLQSAAWENSAVRLVA